MVQDLETLLANGAKQIPVHRKDEMGIVTKHGTRPAPVHSADFSDLINHTVDKSKLPELIEAMMARQGLVFAAPPESRRTYQRPTPRLDRINPRERGRPYR